MSVDSGEGHHRWKEPETCAVCLDDVSHGDKLVYLQCEHAFHVNCARPWFLQKSTLCPLCKKDTLESLGLKRPKSVRDDSSDTENEAAITTAALPPMAGETAQAVPGESVAAAAVPRDEVEARPPSYSEAASPQTEATAGNDSQQALANPQPARLAGQPTTQAHF
ncbi:hypothetical protein GQ54DRAFT_261646 [Martensiomyces pterosporus]|nr:hypothetical protein GQ54DRAFT_261646 [Martensiomyces pterosporus]